MGPGVASGVLDTNLCDQSPVRFLGSGICTGTDPIAVGCSSFIHNEVCGWFSGPDNVHQYIETSGLHRGDRRHRAAPQPYLPGLRMEDHFNRNMYGCLCRIAAGLGTR